LEPQQKPLLKRFAQLSVAKEGPDLERDSSQKGHATKTAAAIIVIVAMSGIGNNFCTKKAWSSFGQRTFLVFPARPRLLLALGLAAARTHLSFETSNPFSSLHNHRALGLAVTQIRLSLASS
jgi:hypothetical protein